MRRGQLTDLVEAPLVGEDGDVPVVAGTSYMAAAVSSVPANNSSRAAWHTPDMMAGRL
jgi:hypothetical protein